MRAPRLTVFTKTLNGAANLVRVLPNFREIADEVVVGIDSATSDDSAEIARQYADKVFWFPHGSAIGGGEKPRSVFFDHLFPNCKGDWILQLDHDETLSPEWRDGTFLDDLLSSRSITHAYFPRRWALPGGTEYIATRHWYPNFVMRLFRNIPSLLRIHEDLHGTNLMAGEAHYEARASIIHWILAWTTRQERLARVRFYASRSSNSAREFYLYENQPFAARPLFEPLPEPQATAAYSFTCEPRFRVAIQVLNAPDWMIAGDTGWVMIAIHNGSDRVLRPDSDMVESFGFRICQRWLREGETGGTSHPEGDRWPLPRRINSGEAAVGWAWLHAPAEPGLYRAQLDLVEEGVSWFSSHVEMPVIPIEVKARPDESVWYPELGTG